MLMNISELPLCHGSQGGGGRHADSSISLMNVAALMPVGRGGVRACVRASIQSAAWLSVNISASEVSE